MIRAAHSDHKQSHQSDSPRYRVATCKIFSSIIDTSHISNFMPLHTTCFLGELSLISSYLTCIACHTRGQHPTCNISTFKPNSLPPILTAKNFLLMHPFHTTLFPKQRFDRCSDCAYSAKSLTHGFIYHMLPDPSNTLQGRTSIVLSKPTIESHQGPVCS